MTEDASSLFVEGVADLNIPNHSPVKSVKQVKPFQSHLQLNIKRIPVKDLLVLLGPKRSVVPGMRGVW